MLRSINASVPVAIALIGCFCSCAIATFESLDITSNVVSYGQTIEGESVWIDFSGMPEKKCVEGLIELTCGGSSVECAYAWEGSRVLVSPKASWLKDRKYRIALSGTVWLDDGRRYEASFERFFYWSSSNGFLAVNGTSPSMDAEVSPRESLVVSFNKPIDVNSFLGAFSIKPFCNTRFVFSDDNRTVTIEPVSGWSLNEVYTWSFDDILSNDENPLSMPFESRFLSPVDVTIPEVIAVCPVTIGTDVNAFDESVSIDGHLVDDQPFGVVFSEEMSPLSAISALSIEPSIKGYFLKDGASAMRYVFQPLEPYEAGVRYTLRVATSAADALGLTMRLERTFLFTSLNRHLRVLSVTMDDEAGIEDIGDPDRAYSHALVGDAIGIRICFESSIGSECRETVVDKIRVSPLFPSTASSPCLIAARWEDGAKALSMEWKGFTRGVGDIDAFYSLSIVGGRSGVTDGRGQYMEDDVCIVFFCR